VDGIEPLAKKGLRLQRSDGTSLSLFALPELYFLSFTIPLRMCELLISVTRIQYVPVCGVFGGNVRS